MVKSFKQFSKQIIEFLGSINTAVVLLIAAAIATLVGSILPQETTLEYEKLIDAYSAARYDFLDWFNLGSGMSRYRALSQLGLTNVYFSSWYLILMLVFFVSITLASFDKVFPKAKFAFKWSKEPSLEEASKMPLFIKLGKDIKPENLVGFLKKRFFQFKNFHSLTSGTKFHAMRGAYHRLGASVVHVGIITLMLGACIGMMTGFGGFHPASPGQEFNVQDLEMKHVPNLWFGKIPNLKIKVLKTWKEDYEDGTPKQYYSDLELYDGNDNLLQEHQLKVNHPMQEGSFYTYQNSFAEYITVTFNDNPVDVRMEKIGMFKAGIIEISKDFWLQIIPRNPMQDGEFAQIFAVFPNRPEEKTSLMAVLPKGTKADIGPKDFPVELSYEGVQRVTGLQFKSNPGSPLLYFGFAIMILGVFIAFGSKKQLWLLQDSKTQEYYLAGTSDRQIKSFVTEYTKLFAGFINKAPFVSPTVKKAEKELSLVNG